MWSAVLAAFEQSPSPQAICDREGHILEANPAWTSRFGGGQTVGAALPALSREALARAPDAHSLLTSVEDGRLRIDLERFSKEGQPAYRIRVAPDSQDDLLNQRLSPLFESSLDGISFADLDGTFQLANQAFLDMLGRPAEAVIGHSFEEFTPAEYIPGEHQRYREQLLSGDVSEVYEKHYIHADGHLVPVSIRLALVRDERGEPSGVWAVCRDSSLRNQLIESLTSSERRFRALFRNSLDAIGFWTRDHQLRYANRAYLDMTGYSRDELASLSYTDLTPDGWEEVDVEITRQVEEHGYSDVFEKEILRKDGGIVPVSIRASAFRDNHGQVGGSWVILRDISYYKQALDQLRHSQNLLQQTNRMARVGGWEYDPRIKRFTFTEETYRILAVPQAYDTALANIRKLFDPASQKRLLDEVGRTFETGQPSDFEVRLDGFEPARWLRVSAQTAIDSSGRTYIVGAVQDISEFKARQRSLEVDRDTFQRMAFHDPLTGLPNRLLLEDRFQQLTFAAERAGGHVAILVIDLDDFKEINDRRGHPAGDALLKAIAGRLRRSVRQSDTVARLGGDEFIVLATLESADEANIVAGKLFTELQQPIDWENSRIQSNCSMGVAVYPGQGTDFNKLYEAADKAMYRAKAGGKNRYMAFVPNH